MQVKVRVLVWFVLATTSCASPAVAMVPNVATKKSQGFFGNIKNYFSLKKCNKELYKIKKKNDELSRDFFKKVYGKVINKNSFPLEKTLERCLAEKERIGKESDELSTCTQNVTQSMERLKTLSREIFETEKIFSLPIYSDDIKQNALNICKEQREIWNSADVEAAEKIILSIKDMKEAIKGSIPHVNLGVNLSSVKINHVSDFKTLIENYLNTLNEIKGIIDAKDVDDIEKNKQQVKEILKSFSPLAATAEE